MDIKQIRLLRADEIECRIATINEKGLSLLLFKDARVDQKILDETFTPFGWKRTHQVIDGNLYCTVEIWDEDKKQWVAKQDVGTMSYSEKEKGQASDSFKRACFNWGVGRELYTAPFIWISAARVKIEMRGDKFFCNERFKVREIGYSTEREINHLAIVGNGGTLLYSLSKSAELEKDKHPILSDGQLKRLEKELQRTGVALEAVLERYHIKEIRQMDDKIYRNAMADLGKSKNREAA